MAVTHVANMAEALVNRVMPTVTLWNRLEGRPRTAKFDRALRAEVRDALWMLTKQWQLGEFAGDDAGSPIFAKLHLTTTRLTKYRADGEPVEPFADDVPLEAKVERRPIPFRLGGADASLDLRLLMGRQWLKLLQPLGDFSAEFIARYPVYAPDPTRAADAPTCAHAEAWSGFAAVAGRRMDGFKLYDYLTGGPGRHAGDGIAALDPQRPAVDALAQKFVAWFERLFYQPPRGRDGAWLRDRLEYQFACAAPEAAGAAAGEKVLVAEQYAQGHLDWYSVDVDTGPALGAPGPAPAGLPATETRTLLPTSLTFDGMPNTRWWTFEDGRTNFGDVKPDTTDLAKLLLIEFGLVYANDWFLVPYTVPAGSITRVLGLAVTNVFGERTWVQAAGRGVDDDPARWAMFLLNTRGTERTPADTSLVVLPTVPKVQEGRPLEEVLLIRDEVANMVWGVERTIPLPTGVGVPGAEAGRETLAFLQRDLERRLGAPPTPPPPAATAVIRYQVMTSVPEQWIPFVPVHLPGDNRETQLQRAALPRVLDGDPDPPAKVRPRTALLSPGLDPLAPVPYFLHEEEVPRAGAHVQQRFERTRWRDGRVWVWLAARKRTGRGQGSSGLAFDRIPPVPRA